MSSSRLTTNERREEILDVALDIIFNKGFYNLTIRNIAEKIGVSEAAIYRHYKNKKEIIDCLVDLAFENNTINYEESNPLILLKKIMFDRMQRFEKDHRLTAITFQEEIFHKYSDIRNRFNQQWKVREEILVEIIENGQKSGIFREDIDPMSFVLIYMGSIRMTVFKWKRDGFSYDIKEVCSKIITELFKILEKVERE